MRYYLLLVSGLIILVAVGYLNVLAFRFYWYWLLSWFDLVMHLLGGLGLGLVGFGLVLSRRPEVSVFKWREIVVGIVGIVMILSFTWELFEFTTDQKLGNHIILRTPDRLHQGAADTATDLGSDLLGVLAASTLTYLTLWRRLA